MNNTKSPSELLPSTDTSGAPRHGTNQGYAYYHCSCLPCRLAHNAVTKANRIKLEQAGKYKQMRAKRTLNRLARINRALDFIAQYALGKYNQGRIDALSETNNNTNNINHVTVTPHHHPQ